MKRLIAFSFIVLAFCFFVGCEEKKSAITEEKNEQVTADGVIFEEYEGRCNIDWSVKTAPIYKEDLSADMSFWDNIGRIESFEYAEELASSFLCENRTLFSITHWKRDNLWRYIWTSNYGVSGTLVMDGNSGEMIFAWASES